MLGEHMSILCATIVLILFRDVPLLFPFQAYTDSKDPFGGEFNWTRQLLIAFGMLVGEFLADSICILYDMRMHKLPIVDTWKKYSLKVLVICVGLSSMIGIPGMIVGSLMATGTSAECSSMNLCYCIRTSSMRPGSLGERYCERLYPITAGEPYGIQAVFVMGFETGLEWTSTRLEFELIRPVRSSASLATVVSTQHYDAYPAREDALSLSRAVLDKDFAFRDMPGMVIFVIVGASDQEPAILARNGSLCDDVPPMLALRAPTPALFAAAVDEIVDGRNVSSLAFSKMSAMAEDVGTWGRVLASARFSLGVVCASLASLSCLVLALWMRFSPVNREVDMAQNATFILRLPQLYKSTVVNDIFMSNMIPLNAVVFFPQFVFLPCRLWVAAGMVIGEIVADTICRCSDGGWLDPGKWILG
ncbi:Hypothetical Protein FCC1311_030682 [Hondaea fermentalgiana]|uniref:Uncharacterized protein n=1 Tax=Hondaea fermentalgiana TaxID=2315210 RepID=A0A2R5G708_9STRA|nr:Hypothetical Protein FCC1311_030682 [Hondaea fermentalgiana]|eukprot:GBG26846.1 Hypothetical Protein FCC1311_030682 [Hondaea fermentalgiana]